MPGVHAKLSASSAHRWMECTGSVLLSEKMPDTATAYGAEGTYAHHIAAECLKSWSTGEDDRDIPIDWLHAKTIIDGFEVECTQDMVDAVNEYLDFVHDLVQPAGAVLLVEQDFTPALQTLDPEFGGTGDCVVWNPAEKLLDVADYKHGAGIPVSIGGNKQLRYYAVGALMSNAAWAPEKVRVTIVQPRCRSEGETIRSETFDAYELMEFVADMKQAAEDTRQFTAPLTPGESQCQWCRAKAICPALEKAQHALMAAEFDDLQEKALMDPNLLSRALAVLPLVEERIHAIREFAYAEGVKGNPPPGWKIVAKRANRKWKDEAEVIDLVKKLKVDGAFTEPELRSPAQIEKLLKKEDRAKLEPLVEKISSGYTLVEESDKRPAAMLAAPDDFDVVTDQTNQEDIFS